MDMGSLMRVSRNNTLAAVECLQPLDLLRNIQANETRSPPILRSQSSDVLGLLGHDQPTASPPSHQCISSRINSQSLLSNSTSLSSPMSRPFGCAISWQHQRPAERPLMRALPLPSSPTLDLPSRFPPLWSSVNQTDIDNAAIGNWVQYDGLVSNEFLQRIQTLQPNDRVLSPHDRTVLGSSRPVPRVYRCGQNRAQRNVSHVAVEKRRRYWENLHTTSHLSFLSTIYSSGSGYATPSLR